ncbi:MAG: DUF4160 domain-containing protein [Gammaproteobacteria bacterium]|jgi:hypothetical protein
MPTISMFYGIIVSMFYADHAPPHIHVQYAEFKGIIDIEKLAIIKGNLPRRALELTIDWTELHQSELLTDWYLCQKNQAPNKIEPLK